MSKMTVDGAVRYIRSTYGGREGLAETPRAALLLADEVERLRAIVGKLPKTADGVPVVPGETYWCAFGDNTGDYDTDWVVLDCRYVGYAKPHVDYDWEIPGALWEGACSPPGFDVYSTREAAESAAGEEGES